MNDWAEEKRALVATIKRQERDAAKLARRFKLLQHTLVKQQALLDRYQRALQQQQGEGDGKTRASVPTADQLGETQNTVACLTGNAVNDAEDDDGRVNSRVASERDCSASNGDVEKEGEADPTGAEDLDARHEETATCLSPPLAAVEATPPPLLAIGDAPDLGTPAPQTARHVSQALSDPNQRKPAQPSTSTTKSKEMAVNTSKTSDRDAFWTRRRKSELSSGSLASKSASTTSADAMSTSAACLLPLASGPNATATTKRPRPAPAKWADVKKQRAATAPAPSTGLAAATASSRDKENRQFAYVEVVRNREARAALPAHDCPECAKYYAALGDTVSAEQVAEHKRACSRHRARYQPYETPDDFWRLSFPDSEPTT